MNMIRAFGALKDATKTLQVLYLIPLVAMTVLKGFRTHSNILMAQQRHT